MTFRAGLAVCAFIVLAGCGGGSAPAPLASPPSSPLELGQTAPVAPNSSLFVFGASSVPTRLDFGAAVPPGETFTYLGVLPPGVTVVSSYVTGALFTIGPNAMPVSALAGVTVNLGASTPSQALAAFLFEQGTFSSPSAEPSADLPLAVAPSTQFQTTNPPTSTPLTTLRPATTYWIFISKT